MSESRNTGLQAATGDYVFFLDSDDYIFTDTLRLMAEKVKIHADCPPEIVVGYTKRHNDSWVTRHMSICNNRVKYDYSNDRRWCRRTILRYCFTPAWNKLICREWLLHNKLLFYSVVYEDNLWQMMVAQKLNCLAVVEKDTIYYRQRPRSICATVTGESHRKSWHDIVEHMLDVYEEGETASLLRTHIFARLYVNYLDNYYAHSPLLRDYKIFVNRLAKVSSQRQRLAIWMFTKLPPFLAFNVVMRNVIFAIYAGRDRIRY